MYRGSCSADTTEGLMSEYRATTESDEQVRNRGGNVNLVGASIIVVILMVLFALALV